MRITVGVPPRAFAQVVDGYRFVENERIFLRVTLGKELVDYHLALRVNDGFHNAMVFC